MPTPVQATHWATHLIETLLTDPRLFAGNENAIFSSWLRQYLQQEPRHFANSTDVTSGLGTVAE
jgi:hypothetical protein